MYTLKTITNKTAGQTQQFFIAKDQSNNPTDWVIALDWENTDKFKFVVHIDTAKEIKANPDDACLSYRASVKTTEKGEDYTEIMVFKPKPVETFMEM